jgi:hypothetical protein
MGKVGADIRENSLQAVFGFIAQQMRQKKESALEAPVDVESWFLVRTEFMGLDGRQNNYDQRCSGPPPALSSMNSSDRHIATMVQRGQMSRCAPGAPFVGV